MIPFLPIGPAPVIPTESNVRDGVSYGFGQTGTLDPGGAGYPLLDLSVVKIGEDRGDGGTGTYDGSDRWSDPLASNVRLGVTYKANSTSNNRTGTLNVGGGSSAGSGADQVTLTIVREGAVPVEGAEVWVTSDAAGDDVVAGTLETDANGQVTFMLDAGTTYYVWSQGGGANPIMGEAIVAVAD